MACSTTRHTALYRSRGRWRTATYFVTCRGARAAWIVPASRVRVHQRFSFGPDTHASADSGPSRSLSKRRRARQRDRAAVDAETPRPSCLHTTSTSPCFRDHRQQQVFPECRHRHARTRVAALRIQFLGFTPFVTDTRGSKNRTMRRARKNSIDRFNPISPVTCPQLPARYQAAGAVTGNRPNC
jgi:hypothetical protein